MRNIYILGTIDAGLMDGKNIRKSKQMSDNEKDFY